jgi:hypothetical protein|tara:strand:- start:5322 stop:5753 length:432 start_codon:yes stop_codon:yes gene_type:complete
LLRFIVFLLGSFLYALPSGVVPIINESSCVMDIASISKGDMSSWVLTENLGQGQRGYVRFSFSQYLKNPPIAQYWVTCSKKLVARVTLSAVINDGSYLVVLRPIEVLDYNNVPLIHPQPTTGMLQVLFDSKSQSMHPLTIKDI